MEIAPGLPLPGKMPYWIETSTMLASVQEFPIIGFVVGYGLVEEEDKEGLNDISVPPL